MRRIAGYVFAGAVLLASCGQNNAPQTTTQEDQSQYATEALADHAACDKCMYDPAVPSLTAAMPSTTHNSDGNLIRVSTLVATGTFTGWSKGKAEHWNYPEDEDGDKGIEVAWDDPAAETRIIKMDLSVSSVIDAQDGAHIEDTASVWVVVPGDRDAEQVAQGLIDLDETVLFLEEPGWLDDTAWTVALNGGLIGDLNQDGTTFTMPIVEHLHVASSDSMFTNLEINADTIAELERAAENPQTIAN